MTSQQKKTAPPKTKVYVLYTGGTFGMSKDLTIPGHPLRPMALEELGAALPDPNGLAEGVEITLDKFNRLLDSSSMNPKDWENIAKRIEKNYEDHDGFVIIQGTDTLSYTASALSFIFENLGKPVVVTGSQLPLENSRTDAISNYGHALMLAAYKATDLPKIPEVIVVFADKIIRGCRARKMSASSWTGFESPNCPELGEIGEHVRIYENQIRPAPAPGLNLQLNVPLNSDVLDISLFPGLRPDHLSSILRLDSIGGVIFRTYGAGNAPDDPEFLEALKQGIDDGNKTVVNITQCPQGSVDMGLYLASVGLLDNGVISGGDMTPEAALTKLMVTLGTKDPEQVKLQMQVNQRGEQSQNLFDLQFQPTTPVNVYSGFVVPDRRFDPGYLSAASLRIKNMQVDFDKNVEQVLIEVYMNASRSILRGEDKDLSVSRKIHEFTLSAGDEGALDIVSRLSKEQVKDLVGDSDITLMIVANAEVKFSFENLSLSFYTQA